MVSISVTEYKRLLAADSATTTLAQIAASVTTYITWIIDSGASNHMSSSPHGSISQINGLVIASTSSSLSLPSIYFVPNPFNLLSVNQLTKSLNCSITFFPTHCAFQDL